MVIVVSAILVLSDTHADADKRFTPVTVVGMSNNNNNNNNNNNFFLPSFLRGLKTKTKQK